MGQVVRDLGMTLLVALVIHALYATRHARSKPVVEQPREFIYATPVAAAAPTEQPPPGFSVFPWAP
jgi:hypothetical protein